MKIGVCVQPEESAAAKAAGFDYLEPNAQLILRAYKPEEKWTPPESALPMLVSNVLLPPTFKVVGPDVDPFQLRRYMTLAAERAKAAGVKNLVFGSGTARNVPKGFDRDQARKQLVDFAREGAALLEKQSVMLTVEPLDHTECNILTSLDEVAALIKTVNHPNFRCVFDAYHFWMEDEPIDHLRAALPLVKHVHLADKEGRTAPGESGKRSYHAVFHLLRSSGYDGTLTVESNGFDLRHGARVVDFIKKQWESA